MSDFVSNGWSLFVAAATVAALAACLVLLVVAARRRVMAGDDTTGHVWDGDLRELNNPLPRWWMVLFVLTVVFAGVYLVLYPGLGARAGVLDWSSRAQWDDEQARAAAAIAPAYAKFRAMPAEAVAAHPEAMAIGERLFANHCAPCHGADARGSKGFPNLTDADWLGGTGADYIARTVARGRTGSMPPMAAAVGSPEDVRNVAHHVLSLSGGAHDNVRAQLGRSKFAACAACHGADGRGNAALGAPNLADKVWLHGWGEEAVVAAVNAGRTSVMPAFEGRLTPEQIHVLAAYVWSLSAPARPGPAR